MIEKLFDEATGEAEQKGFCDTELGTNKLTREKKSSAVEMLTASIEEMSAKTTQLSEEVTQLSEEVTAIGAIDKALGVLKEFYAKAAGATALAQTQSGGA